MKVNKHLFRGSYLQKKKVEVGVCKYFEKINWGLKVKEILELKK